MYRKTRSKASEKPREAANLQFSQKVLISHTCKTKLGCVLQEGENTIFLFLGLGGTKQSLPSEFKVYYFDALE